MVLTITLIGFLNYAQQVLARVPMVTTQAQANDSLQAGGDRVPNRTGECSCLKEHPFWGMALEMFDSQRIHQFAHRQTDCHCGVMSEEPAPSRAFADFR